MFQLTLEEVQRSRSQSVILNAEVADIASVSSRRIRGRGQNIRYLPFAFTEQGVAMLSTVLRS
ncbi:MAG TPA: ORF6N domain-containing protein, partial [Vicinamibacterales bacterium]